MKNDIKSDKECAPKYTHDLLKEDFLKAFVYYIKSTQIALVRDEWLEYSFKIKLEKNGEVKFADERCVPVDI